MAVNPAMVKANERSFNSLVILAETLSASSVSLSFSVRISFESYIQQSEPQKREKGYAWQTAIGLQAVDGLKPSEYLIETARKHCLPA